MAHIIINPSLSAAIGYTKKNLSAKICGSYRDFRTGKLNANGQRRRQVTFGGGGVKHNVK